MTKFEVRQWGPVVGVVSGTAVAALAIVGSVSPIKGLAESIEHVIDNVSITSATPYPSLSPSGIPTPTPFETISTPSEDDETATSSESPSSEPTETSTPSSSPTEPANVSPSPEQPLNATVTNASYVATGQKSGLAYIDTKNPNTSTEFTIHCKTGSAVLSLVSYTNGSLTKQLHATPHPELTSEICDGTRVAEGMANDPASYARLLLPLAGIS